MVQWHQSESHRLTESRMNHDDEDEAFWFDLGDPTHDFYQCNIYVYGTCANLPRP